MPKRIEEIDQRIAADEAAMADPGLYARDPAGFDRLSRSVATLRDEKDAAEMRWLELAEAVENMR